MAIDDLVEQLAFGQSSVRVSSCLGLFLSPEAIHIAQTRLEKGKLVVDQLVRIPLPAPAPAADGAAKTTSTAMGTLNTDFLAETEKIGALIRQSMSQLRWNSKYVFVSLSYQLGLLRYFTMPAIDRRFWKSAVPLEAKKYIPIPFDQLNHDFQVVALPPDAGGKARQGALVAVTQKKNSAGIGGLLESLGLQMVGMEVAPCSVMRLWEFLDKPSDPKAVKDAKPYCHIHFDGGNIRILVADKGIPVFFRDIFLGAEPDVSDLRKLDLGGCISFAQKQLGVAPISQIRLSGSGVALAAWQEAVAQETGLAAAVSDTPALLGIKAADWGGYAAIGASARHLAPSATTLDLAQVGKISEEERRAAKDIFIVSGVIALWFLAAGMIQGMSYRKQARELASYKRDPMIEMVFAGKPGPLIEDMMRSMRLQTETAQSVAQRSAKATAILKDVIDSLPEKVWINKLSLTNPLMKAGALEQGITLYGHCVGATTAEERDLAYEFKARLAKTEVLGKLYGDLQVSYSVRPITEEARLGLDPNALAEKLEERTQFTITARTRK